MSTHLISLTRAGLVMVVLLLLGSNHVSAQHLLAEQRAATVPESYQQPAQQQRTLESVLEDIKATYQINLAYERELLQTKTVDRYEVGDNETVDTLLERILQPLQLQVKKVKGVYVVQPRLRPGKVQRLPKRVPASSSSEPNMPLYQQPTINTTQRRVEKTITGKVTDLSTGETLPGVNILVKGTTIGTITDVEGNYRLTAPDDAETLVFSSVGYTSEEVTIGNQTVINLSMSPDIQSLSEIVVIGYGTQRKSDVTGAIAQVSPQKTADLPNYSVLQSIQGQVPGINITAPEQSGEDPALNIRGTNSLTAGNNPLVVVDGVIYNGSISDFNPNDIASVDILKDASSTAVFGSRAANGVLLITTKQGTTDEPRFNFNTYVGIQEPVQLIDVLDGPGYERKTADYNEILLGDNPDASPIELTEVEVANRDNGRQTDWIGQSLQQGVISNYHLDVSGRSEKTNYYLAGTYFNQKGVVVNDDFDRITLNLNLTNYITDWYSISVRSAYSAKDYSGLEASLDQAYRQSPYGDFLDPDGPGGYAFLPIGDPLGEHPLLITLVDNEDKRTSLRGLISSKLEVPFIEGLTWTLNYAANVRENRENTFFDNRTTVDGQIQNGIAEKESVRFYDWTLDNILNYRRVFGGKHSLDLTFLLSREYRNLESTFSQSRGLVSQSLGYNSIGLGSIQQVRSNFEEQNLIAQMGRLNYSYDGRYAATFTVRRDGFSAFADGNKYGVFPSAAVAWTLSQEPFLQGVNWVDNLKLRVSHGVNGNQAIDRYSSLSQIGLNQYVYGNDGGSIATYNFSTLGNENLTWETTTSTNIGLDFSTLQNRVAVSLNAYLSTTDDLLQARRIPTLSGFSDVLTNIGKMENRGLEIALNYNSASSAIVNWQSGVAFSLNRNEIVSLGGLDADGDGVEDSDIANGWFIGETFNAIFGYQTDGIYQVNDEIPDGFRPGDFRIVDTDEDGAITPEDRVILGTESPNFLISLSNTLQYKRFSLYVLLNSVVGGGDNFYVGDNYETRSVNRRGFTTFSERFNVQDVPYWTPNNPTNDYPRLDYSPPFDHPILESRSFMRIQDISLSYSFAEAFVERLRIQNLRLYASAKNLYTFTSWSGYNPETQTTVQDLPFLRSFTIGLDFSF